MIIYAVAEPGFSVRGVGNFFTKVLFWFLIFTQNSILVSDIFYFILVLNVSYKFHNWFLTIEYGHISLILNSNAMKSELHVKLDDFFLYLVGVISKRDQIKHEIGSENNGLFVLQIWSYLSFSALPSCPIWPCLSITLTGKRKNSSNLIHSFDFIAFGFETREI